MPAPIDPADAVPADRARCTLYYLSRARRSLLDARPYLAGTDAGRNYEGLLSALEERIDRIQLRGLDDADTPLMVAATGLSL